MVSFTTQGRTPCVWNAAPSKATLPFSPRVATTTRGPSAATLELVTHYIDAPSRYARLALERAKELMV